MSLLQRLVFGARAVVRKRQVEEELDAELRMFLQAAVDDRMRLGLSREDATRAARRHIGSLEAVKDRVRDVGWEAGLESLGRDVRDGVRALRRSPGFTSVAVLTLALGIGATMALFSLLDAVMLRPLPVRNPEELVLVRAGGLYPAFHAFRAHTDIFVDLLATSGIRRLAVQIGSGVPEPARVSLVSGSYFSTLGVDAAIGRIFTVDEDRAPARHRVAVVSHGYWQRRLGGDAAIVGRVVRISGTPLTIVGVSPRDFFGEQVGQAPDIWVPLTMWRAIVPGHNLLESPGTAWLRMIGRVRPGQAVSGLQPALTGTFRSVLAEVFGPAAAEDVRRDIARATVALEPAGRGLSDVRAQFARPLQLLMGAVVLVLLIACANIAALLLARGAARRREIDLRLALGSSRARLVRQLLIESLVLAGLGGATGLAFAWAGTEALLRIVSEDGSRLPVAVGMDARMLACVGLLAAATAIVCGLAPAWQSARAQVAQLLTTRGDVAGPPQRLRAVLVVAQVAISLVLLTGASLFLRTIANLREVDLGFAPERLVVLDIEPQAAGYSGDHAIALNRRLLERLAGIPGVSSVSLSESAVLMDRDFSTNLLRPDRFAPGPEGWRRTYFDWVGPAYFSTLGVPLSSGRDFTAQDDHGSPPVVAINDETARTYFPGTDPIGRRLVWSVGGREQLLEIVGVTRDVKQHGPRDEPQLRVYLPYYQMPIIRDGWIPASTRVLVRSASDPAELSPVLRQAISEEEPHLSVARVETGPDLLGRTLVRERLIATLLGGFGGIATGLACLGLYALIAYQVVRRTGEIGIRMALGARPRDVLSAMLRQVLGWIAVGLALGTALAINVTRLAGSLLFGLGPNDTGSLIAAAGVLAALGLLAGYIPARAAARVDPVVALRAE